MDLDKNIVFLTFIFHINRRFRGPGPRNHDDVTGVAATGPPAAGNTQQVHILHILLKLCKLRMYLQNLECLAFLVCVFISSYYV